MEKAPTLASTNTDLVGCKLDESMSIIIISFAPGLLCRPSDLGPMQLEETELPEVVEKLLILAARFPCVSDEFPTRNVVEIWWSWRRILCTSLKAEATDIYECKATCSILNKE